MEYWISLTVAVVLAAYLFYALLRLQDKIDSMTIAKRPTEVRLEENMLEKFKQQVMVAQTLQPR